MRHSLMRHSCAHALASFAFAWCLAPVAYADEPTKKLVQRNDIAGAFRDLCAHAAPTVDTIDAKATALRLPVTSERKPDGPHGVHEKIWTGAAAGVPYKLSAVALTSPAGGALSCTIEVAGIPLARLRRDFVTALGLGEPYSETKRAKDRRSSTAWQYTPSAAVWLSGGLPDKPAMTLTLVRKLY